MIIQRQPLGSKLRRGRPRPPCANEMTCEPTCRARPSHPAPRNASPETTDRRRQKMPCCQGAVLSENSRAWKSKRPSSPPRARISARCRCKPWWTATARPRPPCGSSSRRSTRRRLSRCAWRTRPRCPRVPHSPASPPRGCGSSRSRRMSGPTSERSRWRPDLRGARRPAPMCEEANTIRGSRDSDVCAASQCSQLWTPGARSPRISMSRI